MDYNRDMKKKVYVFIDGSCGEQDVEGIFSNRQKAEEFQVFYNKKHKTQLTGIEEYYLDVPKFDEDSNWDIVK